MTNKYYYKLILFQRRYPELTFNNIGYQYLKPDVQEKHQKQIEEISEILKVTIPGFVKFNNFKPRKDGSFDIRCQYNWEIWFTGVGYFNIKVFRYFEEKKE